MSLPLLQELRERKSKGVAFKANIGEVRNAKSIALAQERMQLGCHVDLCDPVRDVLALEPEYGTYRRSLRSVST